MQCPVSCADPDCGGGEGQGVRTPWKITKNIGFLSNTGSDPLKITKLAIQQSMAFRWRADDGTNSGIYCMNVEYFNKIVFKLIVVSKLNPV